MKSEENLGSIKRRPHCFQSKLSTEIDIALVGDSHMKAIFPGLAKNIPQMNIAFYLIENFNKKDNQQLQDIIDFISNHPSIKMVVLGLHWRSKNYTFNDDFAKKNFLDTLKRLKSSGKIIYLMGDVPMFNFHPASCNKRKKYFDNSACSVNLKELEFKDNNYLIELNKASKEIGGIKVVPVYQYFCGNVFCSMISDGSILYRDEHHLSVRGSLLLGNALSKEIITALH